MTVNPALLFAVVIAVQTTEVTSVALPSGRTMFVSGKWTQVEKLWSEIALVLPDEGVSVICGGEIQKRLIYRQPWGGRDGNTLGFLFSTDGSTCFAWLHNGKQLSAIDTTNGTVRSLFKLPTHVWNDEGLQHVDPHPIHDAHVMSQEGSNLLLLLQEESNEEVAPAQRSPTRQGRHQLVSIPQSETTDSNVASTLTWPGEALAWDFAKRRKEVYLLVVASPGETLGRLVVRKSDGTPLPDLGQEVRVWRVNLALSPDERWLLVEHSDRDEAASATVPTMARRAPLSAMRAALSGSGEWLVLLNLEKDEGIAVSRAYEGSWSPDGKSITYLRDWELWRLDVAGLTEERIAWREPTRKGARPIYFQPPTWSPDGKRLIVGIGGATDSRESHSFLARREEVLDVQSLILDFSRHEFIVVQEDLRGAAWCPMPRPFVGH